jgi:hypothetical protein
MLAGPGQALRRAWAFRSRRKADVDRLSVGYRCADQIHVANAETNRKLGIAATLLGSPATAWLVALAANDATHGRHGAYIVVGALVALPAALAAWLNAILGRDRRAALTAAVLAACVSLLGFVAFVIYFLVTVPEDFFT